MTHSLRYYFDLVTILTQKEIKIRYKHSFFGYLWSLANPICFAVIYYLAFKIFMRIPIEDYALFLICGLFPWHWLSSALSNNLYTYISNASIIKKTHFPCSVLPLSHILMEGIHFILSIPVIIFCLWFYNKDLHLSILYYLPLLFFAQIYLAYGISLIFSTLNLFFRDIERFVSLALMMLFYATPILYSQEMIPDNYAWIIDYNPFAKLIILWRELFLTGSLNTQFLMDVYLIALCAIVIGFTVFNSFKHRFAEVL